MAARILARYKLSPPYDLDDLAKEYGTVEYIHIPFKADGITIGIGGEAKPQIIIDDSAPDTRKKFTLAHELGHIIIPWHTGTIVSHIECIRTNIEYEEMESEANSFAAELLIPNAWLLKIQNDFIDFESFVKYVLDSTGASRDAVFIKLFNTIEFPIICAQINEFGEIIKHYRTRSVSITRDITGENVYAGDIFATEAFEEQFELLNCSYKVWKFKNVEINETDSRPWRVILSEILEETGRRDLLGRINAILPSQYQSHKEKTEIELCSLVIRAYDGRGGFDEVISHPLFPQYVIKRIRELVAKKKNK